MLTQPVSIFEVCARCKRNDFARLSKGKSEKAQRDRVLTRLIARAEKRIARAILDELRAISVFPRRERINGLQNVS